LQSVVLNLLVLIVTYVQLWLEGKRMNLKEKLKTIVDGWQEASTQEFKGHLIPIRLII